ncbi:Lsb5p [Kluyveromyces lactis]|uniref:KLLA0C01320p n=1 Tax=Kluyveromyces lactis (strain ATCC 8585 / CBS 2359 / DSM 70799 / NBRC 1267 / NRRL Y-1140 / WM37) TaxID=284590 RepID=Q6CUY5_KLULA|nr:uncharacterized protein KLLA0_C01320g [Kluyveromyces lactis]CAH01105.1 KLLA0C01320p [Kluyveromyces lactis]|eukprot:XP_452254.1 uncharacterized protein KLLA0_C01320g [Kluyveromyces lactis]
MGFFTDHPYTSVTESINKAVISENATLEVELGNILQLIRTGDTDTNQVEAARAIRKRLKHGDLYQQSRALDLLNLFVSQLIHLPLFYSDFRLINVLLDMSSNSGKYPKQISRKCTCYLIGWYQYLASHQEVEGFEMLFTVCEKAYKNKKRHTKVMNKSYQKKKKALPQFLSDTADRRAVTADERYGIPRIDLEKEAPKIKLLISDSLETAVSLSNALLAIPAHSKSTDSELCTAKFVQARALRRKVLRYLQLITGGELLGALLHANEELVNALMAFDQLAEEGDMASLNERDSDEDDQEDNEAYISDEASIPSYTSRGGAAQPNDPFSDNNKIKN